MSERTPLSTHRKIRRTLTYAYGEHMLRHYLQHRLSVARTQGDRQGNGAAVVGAVVVDGDDVVVVDLFYRLHTAH